MDDFLYNLRRETDKRNRRQGGQQQQYRGPDRRAGKDQRRDFPRRPEGQGGEPTGMLPEIKALLDTVTDNQRLLLENDYRKTEALEVIAEALRLLAGGELPIEPVKRPAPTAKPAAPPMVEEAAVSVAEQVSDEEEVAAAPAMEEAAPPVFQESIPEEPISAEEAPGVDPVPDLPERSTPLRSEKGDVRKLALSLRDKGMTFKEIAKYLDDEKVPTFSGKGGWHAPTIHKLCKEGAE